MLFLEIDRHFVELEIKYLDMATLTTNYLGLKLKNPIIVGSSGLTNSVEKIKKIEAAGAGAVVLKSLFEEQILHEANHQIHTSVGTDHPEAIEYIQNFNRENSVDEYLRLIQDAKSQVSIPVIASVNCFSASEWIDFAKRIESAGADAIELNIFMLNTDKNSDAATYEELYYKIVKDITSSIKIPVAIKLSPYFSNLVQVVDKLSAFGAKGVVLFNRFYEPDVDIEKLSLSTSSVLSTPNDIRNSLRWIGIVSGKAKNIDVTSSTGVHDGEAVIKQLLAGATAVQICSTIYKNGNEVIGQMLKKLDDWMNSKEFDSIEDFRGMLSYKNIKNPALYERVQFMKHFSDWH